MLPRDLPSRVQIVPPGPGGVRDFAQCLQGAWASIGLPSCLQSLDPLQPGAGARPLLARQVAAACKTPHQPVSVLLHYSGYGYHPRGLCHALLHEVEQMRVQHGPKLRLVTYFHELAATGPPWRSAFWLSGIQSGLARRLAALSDAVATNTAHHAQWLAAQAHTPGPVHTHPVFANIESPTAPPLPADREAAVVLFGSLATRSRALQALAGQTSWLRRLEVGGVTEVGPLGPAAAGQPWPHRQLGPLPPPQVSAVLARHRWALIDYPDIHLGKSSVFAAYASHGCLVLNTARSTQAADGLVAGREYQALAELGSADLRPAALEAMSGAAYRWYRRHDCARQARDFASLLLTRRA